MTEQQIETLEKTFPKGFLCVSIMRNNLIHIAYDNRQDSEALHILRCAIQSILEDIEERQKNEFN